jgi:integrase
MTKRANGEGNIYQRANGMWEARVSLPGGKRKSFYGATRAEVQKKMTAALHDVQQGLPVPTGRQTVGQFLDRWHVDVVKPSKRPQTHAGYERVIRLYLAPVLGKTPLERLTPQRVQTALGDFLAAGIGPRRVAYVRTVLRIALGCAVRWGLVPRNVAALTDAPRWEERRVAALTVEQARAFLAACDRDAHGALYATALALGLRRGEALGLRWQDVDLDAGTLTVDGQYQRVGRTWVRLEPKTASSRRTLVLPDFLIPRLRAWRTRQLEQRLVAGPAWRDYDLMFPGDDGAPMYTGTLAYRFARFLVGNGLPPMRFHDLRHGTATLLLAQGVGLREIAEILGHTRIGITADLYAHVAPELKRRAAAMLDAAIGGG